MNFVRILALASLIFPSALMAGDHAKPVDILWVIDNSGSMSPHQMNVIRNTESFMNVFTAQTQRQWKMGLVSTSKSEGPYIGFTPQTLLNYKSPNPIELFQNAVGKLGTYGEDVETSFQPTLDVLKAYPGFLDPKSPLALIIVTDEEEQSVEGPMGLPLSVRKFVDELIRIKGGKASKVITYGVFQTVEKCGSGILYQTSRYSQFMKLSGGKDFSLCDPDFGSVLANMASDLVERVDAEEESR
jgi:hypothetical protein